MKLKLELIFKDRVGIVADISTIIAQQGSNIVSMEVVRREDRAHVYLEIEDQGQEVRIDEIFESLANVADLIQIRSIDTLPQEERENRFRAVLDNISDGVVSIDREGNVTTINRVARQALNCGDRGVVGSAVRALNLPDFQVLECLKGKNFSNVKKDLITATGRYHYFSTCRPIRDAKGRIIGAVEIARDMQEIKKLARSISDSRKIGLIVFTYLHLAAAEELTHALIKSKSINIAYETIQKADGSLPLLTPMSEVAGRMATQQGAKYLEMAQGGHGVLLGGVPGVDPGTVVIIGGGVVGVNAAKMACGLGAKVYILDMNLDRLRYLSDVMPANCIPLMASPATTRKLVKEADVVIGAVLVAGANVMNGKVTYQAVAEAFGLEHTPIETLL
jgi:PAS domain S-box-containing protein